MFWELSTLSKYIIQIITFLALKLLKIPHERLLMSDTFRNLYILHRSFLQGKAFEPFNGQKSLL